MISLKLILESFQENISNLSKLYPYIDSIIISHTIKKSKENLQELRFIPGNYRMTNKPPPNKPTEYIFKIIQPIKDFENNFFSLSIDSIFLQKNKSLWIEQIFQIIIEKYNYFLINKKIV